MFRNPFSFSLNVFLAMLLAWPATSWSAERAKPHVVYDVDLSQRDRQRVTIRMDIRGLPAGPATVRLPVWRTGLYRILDQAGTVSRVTASDGEGRSLDVTKVDKSGWRVRHDGGDLVLRYEVYANALGDRTRYVDDRHAFLNPAAVFMYPEGLRQAPVSVRIPVPAGWRVASGMRERRGESDKDQVVLEAADYDRLADSPIEVGPHDLVGFQVRDARIELAIFGPWDGDEARLEKDVGALVETTADIYGDLPFERYVFIVHSGQGTGGGTEYFNSTVVQTDDDIWWDADGYRDFLALLAHEFFHTWNVKRFRPAGIARYDYQAENYTRSLWVAEGVTSYYDELLLMRAGLVTPERFLERFSGIVHEVLERPAAEVQSLEQSSFDAWIKLFHPGADRRPDKPNRVVSFYDRGAVVSLMLDQAIRDATDDAASLDTLMRELYRRFPLGGEGYEPADLRELAAELAGRDLGTFFEAHVSGTEPLDLTSALARLGLELVRAPDDEDGDEEDRVGNEAEDEAYLGLETADGGAGLARVDTVRSDGPASGVVAGDELVALDGRRIPASGPAPLLRRYQPGDRVRITVLRGEALLEYAVELAARPAGEWSLRPVTDPSRSQEAAFEAWAGQDRPSAD